MTERLDKSIKILCGNDQALLSRIAQLSTRIGQLDKTVSALVLEQNKQVALNESQEERLKVLEAKKE